MLDLLLSTQHGVIIIFWLWIGHTKKIPKEKKKHRIQRLCIQKSPKGTASKGLHHIKKISSHLWHFIGRSGGMMNAGTEREGARVRWKTERDRRVISAPLRHCTPSGGGSSSETFSLPPSLLLIWSCLSSAQETSLTAQRDSRVLYTVCWKHNEDSHAFHSNAFSSAAEVFYKIILWDLQKIMELTRT